MKLKKTIALLTVASTVLPSFAQYEGTSIYDRIGHGQDSINALNNISLYQEAYKSKNWVEAYESWKQVMEKAPLAQVSLYTQGPTILRNLITNATDQAQKKQYFDDFMRMYDTRLQYMNELNSFASEKMKTNKGGVICRKAFDYATYAPVADPSSFSLDQAYNMFTEGINLVNEDPSREVEGFVLFKYFEVSYQKYYADPTGFHEQFLKDYLLCKEVCQKMLEKANGQADPAVAKKIVDQYDPTLLAVENNFIQSKAADRDQLISIFTPKVEEKKGDLSYLRSVIDILADNDCDDTEVYFKASRYAYEIEPSFNAAIGTAQYHTTQGNHSESIKYYDKAIELCNSDKQKARIAMKVVYALAKSGQGEKAESYLQKVETLDPSMVGRCYLFRAQSAATAKKWDVALGHARRAAEEDASISGVSSRLITQINDVKRRAAEYDKANAEYKAQLEKQQRLENFWKGK